MSAFQVLDQGGWRNCDRNSRYLSGLVVSWSSMSDITTGSSFSSGFLSSRKNGSNGQFLLRQLLRQFWCVVIGVVIEVTDQ